eukprot:529694-Rhodomonas_salina.1
MPTMYSASRKSLTSSIGSSAQSSHTPAFSTSSESAAAVCPRVRLCAVLPPTAERRLLGRRMRVDAPAVRDAGSTSPG